MSCVYPSEQYQPPVESSNWLATGDDEATVSHYSFDEVFPKRENFEDVDLSNIPLSMIAGQAIETSGLSAAGFDGEFGQGNTTVSPYYQTHPQTSSDMFGQVRRPMNSSDGKLSFNMEAMTEDPYSSPPTKKHSNTQYSPRKRKSIGSVTTYSSNSSVSPPPVAPPPRKTTHNMIEKRYRTNLNDKIAALRDAVPSLRAMVHRLERGGDGIEDIAADIESLGGLSPAHKLNKATVLSKATEYIAHLERNNVALLRENDSLKSRVAGLEMMVMQRDGYNSVWR